jgi:hypothetical protein
VVVGLLQREPVVAGWEEWNFINNKNHSQQNVLGRRSKFRETLIALQFYLGVFSSADLDKNDWHSQKMLRGNNLL